MIMSPHNTIEMSPWTTILMEVVDVRGAFNEQKRTKEATGVRAGETGGYYTTRSEYLDGGKLPAGYTNKKALHGERSPGVSAWFTGERIE
jgi:hypothetical protein